MSYSLSVITHPSSDVSKPSLMIEDRSSGDRIILGNAPAGLQRKCNEMHLKTSRLTNIFLSGVLDWESLAGLPGMILTVSDQGVKSLNLFHSGNKILQYMISCWRYFIFRFGMDLKAQDTDIPVEKSNIKFTPINIKPSVNYGSNEGKDDDHAKLDKMMKSIFPIQVNSARPTGKKIQNLTLPKSIINPKVSTNWIITPNSVRGKFLVNVAKQLGCEIPHFKPLCNFQPVTLSNGTIITPEQVLEPTRHFNPILLLDIPSTEYLQNTITYDWKAQLSNDSSYSAVFHFLDDSISDPLSDPVYINFINSFGSSTIHFISHKSYCPNSLNFCKTLKVSLKWKTLLPNFFPLPKWSTNADLKISDGLSNVLPLISGQKITIKSTLGTVFEEDTKEGSETSRFTVKDAQNVYDTQVIPANLTNVVPKNKFDSMLNNKDSIPSLRTTVDPTKPLKDQVETLILGTGSALPSTLRNVLCNIVRIPYKEKNGNTAFRSIVLDAGETSFGSLCRLYKPDEVDMILDELSIVYLSHLHADHHLGIVDFIREWNKRQVLKYGINGRRKKLYVVSPWQYDLFMNELNRVDPFVNKDYICPVSCDEFMLGFTLPSQEQLEIENISVNEIDSIPVKEIEYEKNNELSENLYANVGMKKITMCSAFHCDYAYSISMTFKLDDSKNGDTFKLSYSGDTRPKPAFSYIGENSDLLIHESTLEDEKLKDAVDKRHSTTSEAVQVGILMRAKKIILTHFSQRYKSFTCSDVVYKRLANPITKDDLIQQGIYAPSPPSSPRSSRSSQSIFIDDPSVPLEANSNIFAQTISANARANAANIEILFAFDNMKVEYSELGQQRTIFESQSHKLEKLFSEYEEDDIEEEGDEVIASNKQPKNSKKNAAKKQNNEKNKKRKVSP